MSKKEKEDIVIRDESEMLTGEFNILNDKEREESKNSNDFIRYLEGLIVFIETFFERLKQEKMGIEEPLGILKHLLSMLNREKEKYMEKLNENTIITSIHSCNDCNKQLVEGSSNVQNSQVIFNSIKCRYCGSTNNRIVVRLNI